MSYSIRGFRAVLVLGMCSAATACGSGNAAQSPGALPAMSGASVLRGASPHSRAALSIEVPRHPISLGTPDRSGLIFRGLEDALTPPGGAYVGQFQATAVNEYALPNKSNTAPVCTVAGAFVNGIGVNAKRVLYVPNSNGQIATFGPNCGAAGPVLSDPGQQPADVAFDGTKVYVDNVSSGGIDVFLSGHTSKSRSLSNPAIAGGNYGVGTDASHDVFESSSNGVIVEYVGGTGAGTVLPITGLSFPIGLEFDKAQNMIVTDANSGILVYAPPYSGAPARTISFGGRDGFWGKLDAANANLYVSDNLNGTIDVYGYSTGAYKYSFGNGLQISNSVEGVAVDPAAKN